MKNPVRSRHDLASIYPGNGNDQNFQGGGYFQKIFGQGGYFSGSFQF